MLKEAGETRVISRLRRVEVELSADGRATPFAIVDRVAVAGSRVTRAAFPSSRFLQEYDVRIGDALTLRGTGGGAVVDEVLPLLRTGAEEPLRLPNGCPVCQCDLRNQGDDVVCPSALCSLQLVTRVQRLVARDGFSIPELDRESVAGLIAAGAIASPADVFRLHEPELIRRGWPPVRARSLWASIERSKKIPLERLLVATTGVGFAAAHSIAAHARSLAAVKRLATGSLARLPDVGTLAAETVANFMREPRNRRLLAQLARAGVTALKMSPAD